jgi:intein/homing endonuclease
MENYQKIHLWDLPMDRIYIKFNNLFAEKFFNLAHQKFGNYKLIGDFLNLKRADTTLAGNWKKNMSCYPLYMIIALANKMDFPLPTLEENIMEIKYKTYIGKRGGNGGKSIINPRLPILIDENFAEILGHLCADGTISRSNDKKGLRLGYINSEPVLIENFKELIIKVFGQITPNILVRQGGGYRKPNYYLQYPSILSAFVLSVFDLKPGDDKDIPDLIFDMSKNAKGRFLNAMFDDDGTVTNGKKGKIIIGLKPIIQIIKIKKLLTELGIRTGSINRYEKEFYRIEIAEQDSIKSFQKLVGFKHPKKTKRLEKIVQRGWKFKRYYDYECQQRIFSLLEKNNFLDVNQISEILKRHKTTIRGHLNYLKERNFVSNIRTKKKINNKYHHYYLWGINKQNE